MASPLDRLVDELSRLPGIGRKTATRLAFHVLRAPEEEARALARAIDEVRAKLSLCSVCCYLTDEDPCAICRDARRDQSQICVVAQPQDVMALERTGSFRGLYHVLHGVLSPLDGVGPDDLKIAKLLRRLEGGDVQEVIIATSPNVEGDATGVYLAKLIRPLGPRVTRIASGIPIGGELEYADGVTIGRALGGRREL
ncbi:MAG: recombination mediator RecR [Myxococcota bacterium]